MLDRQKCGHTPTDCLECSLVSAVEHHVQMEICHLIWFEATMLHALWLGIIYFDILFIQFDYLPIHILFPILISTFSFYSNFLSLSLIFIKFSELSQWLLRKLNESVHRPMTNN